MRPNRTTIRARPCPVIRCRRKLGPELLSTLQGRTAIPHQVLQGRLLGTTSNLAVLHDSICGFRLSVPRDRVGFVLRPSLSEPEGIAIGAAICDDVLR